MFLQQHVSFHNILFCFKEEMLILNAYLYIGMLELSTYPSYIILA